jgi:hypothetical protein
MHRAHALPSCTASLIRWLWCKRQQPKTNGILFHTETPCSTTPDRAHTLVTNASVHRAHPAMHVNV